MDFSIPTKEDAERIFNERKLYNDIGWVDHSITVAKAAQNIAACVEGMDAETAYVVGLFHDIGRSFTTKNIEHVIAGFDFMNSLGYSDCARVCFTHSFQVKDIRSFSGGLDCGQDDIERLAAFIRDCDYNDYDRLIQLADAISLPSGFCLLEKRLFDVSFRHGFNKFTLEKWKACIELKEYFQNKMGKDLYSVLPGVVENTFRD